MNANAIQFTIDAAANDEIQRLRAVNAELLEALESVEKIMAHGCDFVPAHDLEWVRTAIARARG